MTDRPLQRAVLLLLGSGRGHRAEPPMARQGYSIVRRVIAGLLGVRLLEHAQLKESVATPPRADILDVGRITDLIPRIDSFAPNRIDADTARANITNRVSGMGAHPEHIHVVDALIDDLVSQWTRSIDTQYTRYVLDLFRLRDEVAARLEAGQSAPLRDERRLKVVREPPATNKGWLARRRATKVYRKTALHGRAQQQLLLAGVAQDYYAAQLRAAEEARTAAIEASHALGQELKKLSRLIMAASMPDAAAADAFLPSETTGRIPPASDQPTEE